MRIGMTFNVRAESRGANPTEGVGPEAAADDRAHHSRYAQWADDDEEFDAPETVQALAVVLESLGHEVDLLGEGEPMLRRLLGGDRPDLVLNFAEGSGAGRSREARVPAVLEMLDIPYTGSDPLTLAVTLDKDCAKRLVAASGVATPAWALFDGDESAVTAALDRVPLPWIVKPAFEGSSKGILTTNLIHDRGGVVETLTELFEHYRQPVLIEEFIVGDELTVGLVGNRPPEVLGIMRVLPRNAAPGEPFIYSLEIKRDWEHQVRYECPAQISAADDAAVRSAALAAWQALGCRDVSRIDFRLRDGVPYFLETNPLPGLSPKSGDLVLLAGMVGIDHAELVSRILAAAIERHELLAGAVGPSGR
jgi:D-alanine-D-alanine ligase